MVSIRINFKAAATVLILMLAFSVNSMADPMYYNYNNGISSNSFPFNVSNGKAVNWLILPGELSQPTPVPAGKQITDVYFFLSSSGSATYSNLTIKMAQDDITTLTSGMFYQGPWDTVYSNASINLTGTANSWLAIPLDTPFSYDPTRSLILFVQQSGYTGTGMSIHQSSGLSDIRRVWSVGGAPFNPYPSGDSTLVNFGVDVDAAQVPVVPLPGAVLLGMLGLGAAGLKLRKFA
jgi:trimeric autotransporter adhesin